MTKLIVDGHEIDMLKVKTQIEDHAICCFDNGAACAWELH